MNCPSCSNVPLEEKEPKEGLFLDLCPVCGGAWLDAGEIESLGSRVEGFREEMERAGRTLMATSCPCPRCSTRMDRGWIDEAEVEFKACPSCKGAWMDRERLIGLRSYLKRRMPSGATADEPATPSAPGPAIAIRVRRAMQSLCVPAMSSRARIIAVCAAIGAAGLLYHFLSGPKKASAVASPEAGMSVQDYELAALTRRALAVTAEAQGRLKDAEDEYKTSAEYYYAAIVAAAPPEDWRLELEYAKAGTPIARVVARLGRPAESDQIRKITRDVFKRHGVTKEQVLAWQRQEEGELRAAAGRPR